MTSFAAMKKNRRSMIDKLVKEADKVTSKTSYKDDRQWKPSVDKSGNGYAVIRFLPSVDDTEVPWAQYFDHGFKGPTGRWYIERSRTSLGEPDPLSDMNSQLWNSGHEEDKDIARSRKRRLHYVSNIEVITDTTNPDNEGKVFLYEYGKKIFTKVMDAMQPEFPGEEPLNPFDFWDGANFKIKIRQVEGYRNYDKSEFDAPSPHKGGDEKELEKVFESLYSLAEYSDPAQYKSYADLEKKLLEVLGEQPIKVQPPVRDNESINAMPIQSKPAPEPGPVESELSPTSTEAGETVDAGDEKDTMSFFAKLAQDD